MPLHREHRGDGIFGACEDTAEGIPDGFEYLSGVLVYSGAHDRVVAANRPRHCRAVALPSRRTTLNVGKGKRQNTGQMGRSRHARLDRDYRLGDPLRRQRPDYIHYQTLKVLAGAVRFDGVQIAIDFP